MDRLIPRGRSLDADRWWRRHRAMLVLLALHVAAVPVVGVTLGDAPVIHAIAEGAGLALVALLAARRTLPRRTRQTIAAFGLMTASALVVHAAGDATVAHFHFFVMLALVSVYEDWLPFGVSVAFVLVHHATSPALTLEEAAIHAAFMTAAAAANVVAWRLNADVRDLALHGEARYRSVVDSVSQVIFQTDRAGRWTFLNGAFTEITGVPAAHAIGRPVLDFVHPEDRAEAEFLLRHGGRSRAHFRYLTSWGEERWLEATARPAIGAEGMFGTMTDITERRRSEEQLSHQALHDAVTGLPNRRLFLDRLKRATDRCAVEGGQLAVLFADVDEFKAMNDELGHEAGDELLRRVADVLREELGADHTAARFGGDEFAILCDRLADRDAAGRLAERVLARFDHAPTLSIGIAIGGAGDTHDVLLRDADAAMYRAKASGRNRYEVYDDSMRTSALERLRLEGELREALANDELRLHFQPVVRLSDERIVGMEALIRWEHPERGLVSPAAFVPVAERSGLIDELGGWALEEACRVTAARGDDRWVSVNLSPRQLTDRGLPERVEAALAASGLPGRRLHLELTESVLASDDERTLEALRRLERLGVVLVLDDFGTGYSSLSYLKRFPLDVVKIDRAFVGGLPEDPSDEAIVTAILGMAHALGMTVVAEGIETPEQADRLAELGCEMGQGWHFGHPAPEAQRSAAGQTIR